MAEKQILLNDMREWIKSIIALPLNALVVIPALFLYFGGYHFQEQPTFILAAGIVMLIIGLGLSIWTMVLFHRFGKGTPAPWSPPRNLVVRGPYCFMRNPMLTGVLAILLGESLALGSWQILLWTAIFFIINTLYFIYIEERDLARRFGVDYILYRKSVPRWLPRLSKWTLPNDPSRK